MRFRMRPLSWSCALLLLVACGNSSVEADDDDDDDHPGGGADGGVPPSEVDGGPSPFCVPTGSEVTGDGLDNDCDGLVDEIYVCADAPPFTTIAAAIAAAPDGGHIDVCAGTYPERLVVSDKSVGLYGTDAASTILDAGGAGHALLVTGGHRVTVSGFTIRGGAGGEGAGIGCVSAGVTLRASTLIDNHASANGAGLYGRDCQIEIATTRFEANDASTRGGAAYLIASTGTITDSQFVGNSADEGGAVAIIEGAVDIRTSELTGNLARARGGAVYQMSDGAIEDSTLSGNNADWTGGAIYVWQHAPTMRRNTVSNNEAAWEGGGFYLHQSHAVLEDNQITDNTSFDDGGGLRIFESNAHLERNLISRNHATDGDGGGFKSSHLPSVYIDNEITDNEALGAGGGIEMDNDASQIHGGVVSGNHSSIGGGIHVMLWPWNDGLIEGVRISGNHAWRGGGMYIENNFQPVTLRQLTIEENSAHQGAGIYTRGTPLRLSNSLLRANTADDVGGGFYVDPSASYPWTEECPCPPIDPAAEIDFVVVHGNPADSGAAVWIGAPNVTFESSIFSGHTATAVMVAPGGTPAWRYNDTFPATFSGMSDPTGSDGNLANDPGFMAPTTGDFRLRTTSVCVDAGDPAFSDLDGTRADMGLHAGPDAPP